MRVVQISSDVLPVPPECGGAIETYIWNISRVLSSMNVEVHIVSVGNNEETLVVSDNCYIHTYSLSCVGNVLGIPGARVYRNVPLLTIKLSGILSSIESKYGAIDVIHSHYPATALAPIFWKNILRKSTKLVLTVHGEYAGNILDRIIFSRYDVIHAVSYFMKYHILQKFNVLPKKVKVVHNAVEVKTFKYDEKEALEVRRMLNIDDDPVILYVGRIIPGKGLHKLIKAFSKILTQFPNAKLLIVGPPGEFSGKRHVYFEKVFEMAKELDIINSVIYLGQLPHRELAKVYSAADVVVMPSLWNESFGLVALEAMSCSKPVVAFRVGGIPEIINDGVDGFLATSGNGEELASKIVFLLENPKVCMEMGKNARKKVEMEFSYRDLAIKLIKEVYCP